MAETGITNIGRNRWQVRAQVVDPRSGRKINRKEVVCGTLADAKSARQALIDETRGLFGRRPTGPRGQMSLADYAQSWLEDRVDRLKPSVATRYASALDLHILPALGYLRVREISPSDIQRYVTSRVKKDCAAGNTVLNELRVLRTMAKDALAADLCKIDWCARVTPPKVAGYTDENPNLLTPEQFARMMRALPVKWQGLVVMIATTGLRWGEVSALRWGDIKGGMIHVWRANWLGSVQDPKTLGSVRKVPFLPEVAELLPPRGEPDELIFAVTKGPSRGQMHAGSPLNKALPAACAAAGVPRVTPHGLRRTWNNLARRVAPGDVVRAITGHVTEKMTSHYSRIGADEKTEAARAVAGRLGLLSPAHGTDSPEESRKESRDPAANS